MSGGQTEKQIQLIRDFRPDVIMVTPSYFLALIDHVKELGLDPAETSLRIGVFGAEPWTEAMRQEIEQTCRMHATDIFGLSEMMGPGVAQECVETKDGLTLWEDHFYPEIVDPLTDEPVPDGEEGELVITSLTKQALPVIRYRTRDITTLLPGTARTMRRLARITGRSDDMLIIRGVNVYPSQIEAELMQVDGLSAHYQLHKGTDGTMATLTVMVEALDPAADRAALAAQARERIKTMIGVTATVEVVEPFAVPRSQARLSASSDQSSIRVLDTRRIKSVSVESSSASNPPRSAPSRAFCAR